MVNGLLRAKDFMVFTFPSTHNTLEGESLLHEKGIENFLFPVPVEIGLGCGTALKVWVNDFETVQSLFDSGNVKYNSIWQAGTIENGSWQKVWG